MLRTDPSSTSSLLSSVTAEAKHSDYRLYLLANDDPKSLAAAQSMVKGGNAVLLYPDSTNTSTSSSGSCRYRACFIQGGKLRKYSAPEEKIVEVMMGNQIISSTGALPRDITLSTPRAANLSNMALARAGIVKAPVLLKIPPVVFQAHEAPCMDSKSLASFAKSSFYAHRLTQPELDQRAIEKLFGHILNGEPTKVKKMLDANPRLSLVRRRPRDEKEQVVTNKAGQRIYVQGKTAYQLAHGEEDTETAAMLKAKIIIVADEKEADEQYNTQFPEGWGKAEKKKWAPILAQLGCDIFLMLYPKDGQYEESDAAHLYLYKTIDNKVFYCINDNRYYLDELELLKDAAFTSNKSSPTQCKNPIITNAVLKVTSDRGHTQLNTLTQAIRDAKPGDITSSGHPEYKLTVREGSQVAIALDQFRSTLDAVLNETVTTGRHFNSNLLQRAFQIYDDHYEDYFGNNWSDPRAMLFWQRTIGYIERLFPANYTQAACDGFNNTAEKLRNGTPQGRSFKFEIYHSGLDAWRPADFYPLLASRLGFDFAIAVAAACGGPRGGAPAAAHARLSFSKLMSIKNSRRTELTLHQDYRREASRSSCLVM